ncbi:hypothetical protein [Niabella hibiscisoli]|uniref:hypothetical protein n=1 Tax=Niabella hibiscisoli TaxID=1825928 RepID=UPI001F0CF0C1|nr:hypothetical protein [Niabella hibiscisoli]MCH5716107.1 hypothetical protein [Niabella hibiscisoli]
MEEVTKASKFLKNWNSELVQNILDGIDAIVPEKWAEYRIPDNRRNLILKLLTSRFETIIQLFP